MERGNRALEALKRLQYIDSLESENRASALLQWYDVYFQPNSGSSSIDFDELPLDKLQVFSELFYKNINFLKRHRVDMKREIDEHKKIREFIYCS